MNSNGNVAEAYTPPQEGQELTAERYDEIIEKAYNEATRKDFDPAAFVAEKYTSYLKLRDDSENWLAIQEGLALVGETLACAVTSRDFLETVDQYEAMVTNMRAMSPTERSFARLAVVTDIRASEAIAGKKQVAQTTYADAQLLAILS